jgi:4-hydroxy-tetrahydrodipicolinate synthase
MAAQGGASALLVFPPTPFTLGQSPQMALAHFKHIADATDLPLIVFQYPLATGQGYPKDTLLKLCEEVPTIRAIKDWIGNAPHHEWHIRTLQTLPRPVNVLTTHSAWLFSSLVLGCNGLLSGSGSVIADLQARLFRAVKGDDLPEARRLNDRIEPLMRVFYADPFVDMHNRMKEALVLLGKLPRAMVRPPLVKIERAEIAAIRQALVDAVLLGKNASRDAAKAFISLRRSCALPCFRQQRLLRNIVSLIGPRSTSARWAAALAAEAEMPRRSRTSRHNRVRRRSPHSALMRSTMRATTLTRPKIGLLP